LLATFGNLLRRTIDRENVQHVTLHEELDFIQHYLSIEQIRFKERLQVKLRIEDEAKGMMVPNMILQPLVENAIRHGIAETLKGGRLVIEADLHEEKLDLQIYNDGPTLPEDWKMTRQAGIGLVNTIERLDKLYDDQYSFEITNVEEEGVLVRLILPGDIGEAG